MSKKYIIELEDEPTYISDGTGYFKCLSAPWWMIGDNLIGRLKPYDPDVRENVRGEWADAGWEGDKGFN